MLHVLACKIFKVKFWINKTSISIKVELNKIDSLYKAIIIYLFPAVLISTFLLLFCLKKEFFLVSFILLVFEILNLMPFNETDMFKFIKRVGVVGKKGEKHES